MRSAMTGADIGLSLTATTGFLQQEITAYHVYAEQRLVKVSHDIYITYHATNLSILYLITVIGSEGKVLAGSLTAHRLTDVQAVIHSCQKLFQSIFIWLDKDGSHPHDGCV